MSKITTPRHVLAVLALSGAILAPAVGVAQAEPSPAPGPPVRDAAFWDRYDQWSVTFAQCLAAKGVTDPGYDRASGWSGGAQTPTAKRAAQECESIVGLPPTITEK
ncbi:hypothetical protein FK268_02370 [Tsukamurella sputi]|uniref:Uncharacterized protein n=1 Tax=Tsukamurella sputi TaxID=2591848 RepID=A0A5C5RUE6_9ACTN|nr:hypothetical protein [Tsukamurella sputi]TWS26113.1 hypothetical protein FK268_02370 [Tsukamurella sputi]